MNITDFSLSNEEFTYPSPLQTLHLPHWPQHAPRVWVKRDDLIHHIISGNKWRKLQGIALNSSKQIVSIGGGYSNHLHALGYLCARCHIPFTALVRGDYSANLTPMLSDLTDWGGNLHYLTKQEYAQRDAPEFSNWLNSKFADAQFIPEGGSTQLALKGVAQLCREVSEQCNETPSHYLSPVASGATLAGIITGVNQSANETQVIGIAVLKGQHYLEQQVQRFLHCEHTNWHIDHNFVHRGYAKSTPELRDFVLNFYEHTGIPVETVYSAKLFYALDQLILAGYFTSKDKIIALHTGGLQGVR